MSGLSYPATRYAPSPVIDFAAREERKRLSPSALKAFFNIVELWHVRDEECAPAPRRGQQRPLL